MLEMYGEYLVIARALAVIAIFEIFLVTPVMPKLVRQPIKARSRTTKVLGK